MNVTKITASLLAITMLLSCGAGTLALAQEGAIPSAAEVSIAVPVEASPPGTTDEPTEAPTDIPTATDEPTEVPTDIPTATDEPTEVPTDIPTATDEPTEVPTDIPTATDEPTEMPTPSPPPVVSEGYVVVKRGTKIYLDVKCRRELGQLSEDSILYLRDVGQHENKKLYEAQFDTKVTKDDSRCELGYLAFSTVSWLENDAPAFVRMESKRITKDIRIPFIPFEYVNEMEIPATEAPKQYTVTCVNNDGTVLLSFSVPADILLTQEELQGLTPSLYAGQRLKGWHLCDETGALLSDQPVDAAISVTQDLWLKAVIENTVEQLEPSIEPNRSAKVTVLRDTETLELGTTITLQANLKGYDGVPYICNWQTAEIDMEGNFVKEWQDAGISTTELSYTLTEENLLTAWRLCVIEGE